MDIMDGFKKRDTMIPPRSMIFIGDGDFEKTGNEFKNYFIELGGLQPNAHVLDVGCGIGRMAIPLTNYLSSEGEYWGFDIVKSGIDWCQNHITPKYTNFHFLHSNIYNRQYHPEGEIHAKKYKFPFEDQSFDFVFLTSVFTHMLPSDVEHYTEEIARVLKTGGKCLITFFLLNDESTELIREGNSRLDFRFEMDGFLTTDKSTPEDAIAYQETYIKDLLSKHGVSITEPVYYGSWCGRQSFLAFQDIVVAEKI